MIFYIIRYILHDTYFEKQMENSRKHFIETLFRLFTDHAFDRNNLGYVYVVDIRGVFW